MEIIKNNISEFFRMLCCFSSMRRSIKRVSNPNFLVSLHNQSGVVAHYRYFYDLSPPLEQQLRGSDYLFAISKHLCVTMKEKQNLYTELYLHGLCYLENHCLKNITSLLYNFQIFLLVTLCLSPQMLQVKTFWGNSQKKHSSQLFFFFSFLLNIYSGSKLECLWHHVKKETSFFLDACILFGEASEGIKQ